MEVGLNLDYQILFVENRRHVGVVVCTVDKALVDNMDVVCTEDMVEKSMCKVSVVLVEVNKVAVVNMEEIQSMELMMVHLEVVEFEEVALYLNVKEQNLGILDLMGMDLDLG